MDEFAKLKEIIQDKLDVDTAELTLDTTFESMKVDSLDMVEIIMAIEETFDIAIDVNPDQLATLGDLVEYIKKNK